MKQFRQVIYEKEDNIAIITLNRPEARNATHRPFQAEIDEAWAEAEMDEGVQVIVLKANGPSFSAGADTGSAEAKADKERNPPKPAGTGGYYSGAEQNIEKLLHRRDIPKATIAAVQGHCIAGGLLLIWPCDIIIAAEDAQFSDPVARAGLGGVLYFGHPFEFGFRKAKEVLFTGGRLNAQQALQVGMVNKVVPKERLVEETMAMAREIAKTPPLGVSFAKRAINHAMDQMGYRATVEAYFGMHQLAETYNRMATGSAVPGFHP